MTMIQLLAGTVYSQAPADGEIAKQTVVDVEAILQRQAAAWNNGDIESFMDYYWRSDQLTFSSGGETTRGWQATLDRYKNRYPDRATMGQLTFDNLEMHELGPRACYVLGRWHLQRESEPLGGIFTLVVRKFSDRWLIVHDHTSLQPPSAREDQAESASE